MAKMKSDTPLDFAVFQLSPKRSRCELFVSSDGSTEKLASGLLKPFVAHLKVAEEQIASAAQSIKLEVGRRKNAKSWFTKGTLDRFVRFVSTPEVLELINTFDAEMSQLEAARRIYSQGARDQLSGGGRSGVTAADDATKNELLRAIDVRLEAVQQDLSAACARAAAAGFDIDTVSELQMFADRFGAHRLNEACGKFISLWEKCPDLVNTWRLAPEDRAIRCSYGSDMSIDDDPPSPSHRQEPTMPQQPNAPSISLPVRHGFSRESSMEREDGSKPNTTIPEKDGGDESSTTPESFQSNQPARRLSVLDRVNLFENKQKENSGGKPPIAKSVELRRLSSDVSSSAAAAAAEKAILKRWSGASDMSIDLSVEKKDVESPLCTPSSVEASQDNKVLNSNDDNAKSSVVKPDIKIIPSLAQFGDGKMNEGSFSKSEQVSSSSKSSSDSDGFKDQGCEKTQSRSFISRAEGQEKSEEKFKTFPGDRGEDVVEFKDQRKLKGSHGLEELSRLQMQVAADKNQDSSLTRIRTFGSKGGRKVEFPNQRETSESRDESSKTCLKATWNTVGTSRVFEGVAGPKIQDDAAGSFEGIEGDSLFYRQEARSVGETNVVNKKESHSSDKVSARSISSTEDSGPERKKFNIQRSAAELSKKTQVQRAESSFSGNNRTTFFRDVTTEAQDGFNSFSSPPAERIQRVRQSKVNQDLNDELKMKANELEKLFAEHKLRVPGDQSNSSPQGKSGDPRREPQSSLYNNKSVADASPQLYDHYRSTKLPGNSKSKIMIDAGPLVKTVDHQNGGDALNKNFSELSVSEGSRGRFYDRYMQKRDAKLRAEWNSDGVEKDARLRSMLDNLERNRSEMKAKFSGSVDRQDSISSAKGRAERLRSYNSRSIMQREQQHLDFGDSEDQNGALDYLEQNQLLEDSELDDTCIRDGISRGSQGKKLLPNKRSLLSSTHFSAAPVLKSATKTSTVNYEKQRVQHENPLTQSSLRKENTKPSARGSKVTRSQVRNYARSNNTSEAGSTVREDKSSRSQSLRKTSANPSEIKEMSPLESDGVVLTPIKFDQEVLESVGTKSFLKKGSRTAFVTRASIARHKIAAGSNPIYNVKENDDLATGPDNDNYVSTVKDEGFAEFVTLQNEGIKILDRREPRIELESDKFVNTGSGNSDETPTFSHVNQVLGSELPTEIPSTFPPVESIQGWPEECPMSWNSHTQHPFFYPHEMSDVDASVDSPVESPASWNSQSLNHIVTDASRMRKKWGTDMTRGFKRLLKFGRKKHRSERLVDWMSATTSEGDDDTEDGRYVANRSSEDLRKSRMGLS